MNILVCMIWVASINEALVKAEHSKATSESTNGGHSSEQDDLPNDPYMSYLFLPRLTFTGTFQADTSTVNNIPSNYDTANFVQTDYLLHGQLWNTLGTGEWNVNANVTHVCYANETCVADEGAEEPIVGTQFQEGGNKTSAKMVDLDTEAQMFSKIWGWRIRVGNFFSADFTPVPFQYMWMKVVNGGTLSPFGSAYQSVLTNIHWLEDESSSPLIQEWREIMKKNNVEGDKLSIRFNVDMYELDPRKTMFTYGRLTGSIGLLGTKSPPFFSHGRMLHTQSPKAQSAPFIVDKKKQKVYIDFGNSFQTTSNGSFDTGDFQNLYVGLPLKNSGALTCDNEFLWLGKIYQTASTWYSKNAGIQSFPAMGALSEKEVEIIKNNPLVVAEVTGIWPAIDCKEIVLAESLDGIDIHPYDDWTMHKDPEETAEVKLIATKFGNPLPNVKVKFQRNTCTNIFADGPPVAVPEIPPPDDALTNSDGIAKFAIIAKDPQNPRGYIDGQLYPYTYALEGQTKDFSLMCKENVFALLNHLMVIAVFDQYGPYPEPTWLDNIYPIFQQYANLYPVMTLNFVDLGNYYEVIGYKKQIQMSMELPISHPNYMPVTRDLSSAKRKVILDWLKKEDPPTGEVKNLYTVENLRKDLQTALQIEQATIPPYLTALASIKHDYNNDAKSIIRSIVIQEMMHMNLVANILNAVGGSPVLHSKDFVPMYPSRLPGGVQPDLVVPIEKLSTGLIRNVFMKIEQPTVTQEKKFSFEEAFSFIQFNKHKCSGESKYSNQESCSVKPAKPIGAPGLDEREFSCLDAEFKKESLATFNFLRFGNSLRRKPAKNMGNDSKDGKFQPQFPNRYIDYEKHHNTIGAFYNHILNSLGYLTDCGQNNSIFTGDPNRQVDFSHWSVHGHSLEVTDFNSAVEAIRLIVEQGEGSSPCNPVAWSNGTVRDLSHYFLFYSMAEKRQIRVVGTDSHGKIGSISEKVNFTKLCNGTYFFTGPKIPFDPDGVWPMISNPKMAKFKKGSKAYLLAAQFDKIYTKLLKSLEYVFNGHPDSLRDAIGLMYSVNLHLKKLVRTPIDPDGDPDVGPNAGPPFDFSP